MAVAVLGTCLSGQQRVITKMEPFDYDVAKDWSLPYAKAGYAWGSVPGIFVESAATVKIGDEVQLFVGSMRSSAALRTVARVMHVEPGVGFGARFVDEDEESRSCVANFIDRFRKSDT